MIKRLTVWLTRRQLQRLVDQADKELAEEGWRLFRALQRAEDEMAGAVERVEGKGR